MRSDHSTPPTHAGRLPRPFVLQHERNYLRLLEQLAEDVVRRLQAQRARLRACDLAERQRERWPS
jgi:hypothetical protein